MADANVILRIGSAMGPGGLASLQAGVQMIGALASKAAAAIKGLDKFAQVHKRLTIDISQADQATVGLVDTMALMQNAMKFEQAQMRLTAEEFRAVNVVAANHAKAVGGDVTEAANKLTDAISKGQSRALKELGIELENTEDLQLAQAEAMEKIIKLSQGLTVEVENISESLFVVGNHIGTMSGLLWEAVGSSGALGDSLGPMNGLLGDINRQLEEAPQAYLEYTYSLDRLHESALFLGQGLMEGILAPIITIEQKLNSLMGIGGKGTVEQYLDEKINQIDKQMAHSQRVYELKAKIEKEQRRIGREERASSAQARSSSFSQGGSRKKGGKKKSEFGMEFSTEEASMGDDIDFITGGTVGDLDDSYGLESSGSWDASELLEQEIEMKTRIEEMREKFHEDAEARSDQRQFRLEQLADTETMLQEMRVESAMRRAEDSVIQLYEREEALNFGEQFGDVWESSLSKIGAGGLAAKGSMDLLHRSVGIMVTSAIKGGASMGEAFRQAVVEIGTGVAIEATFHAALELGHALAAFATGYGSVQGAMHLASMAQYLATAAIAGGAAGIAHSMAPSASSAASAGSSGSSTAGAGSSSYTPSYERSEGPQRVEVVIKMEEDGWGAFVDKNERELMDGRPGFGRAA